MNTRTICRALVALAFLLVTETRAYTPVSKEQQRILLPSSTRIVTSLAGPWERSVDDGDWTPVYLPRSESFDGRISYRRSFTVDDQAARSMSWNLSFLGLADAAEVTINDRYVGKFFGGMTPFMAHIPDKIIKAGTNTIRLVVYPASDNAVRARKQQLFGQRIATGVVRELFLVGTPQISLGDVRTTIEQTGSGARVTARTTAQVGSSDKVILGDSAQSGMSVGSVTVTAQLRSPNDGIVMSSGQQQLRVMKDRVMDLQFDLPVAAPHWWSPSDPALYTLDLRIEANGRVIDELSMPVGLATYGPGSVGSQGLISLNGQPVFVKSVDYVEEVQGDGSTVSCSQIEKDVVLLRTLGVNCIHTLFSAPHPYLAYLCAKNGIMIIADLPVYDIPSDLLGADEIRARLLTTAERMTAAYERIPALAMWNIASGLEQHKPATADFLRYMSTTMHRLSSRPVSQTVRFRTRSVVNTGIDAVIYQCDRFDEGQEAIQAELQRCAKLGERPFALSYGKPVQPENRNGYADPISAEAQARYVLMCYRALRAAQSGGSTVWTLTDYSLNHSTMLTNTAGEHLCTIGIADLSREPRIAFSMYKAWLNDEKDPTLQAGLYTESNHAIFIGTGLLLIMIMALMLNRSRRFREYAFRAVFHAHNFASDIRDQRILSRTQTVMLAVVIAGTLAVMLTTILYHARRSTEAEYLLMLLFPQEGLKTVLSSLAWRPDLGIIYTMLIVLVKQVAIAGILRLVALFVRSRITFADTYIITVWSCLPVLFFLPFATILVRALDVSSVPLW
ncbi:MAG: sugar-binding domain-containing protein, partial [Candidatus Kapaibacterium sp.]